MKRNVSFRIGIGVAMAAMANLAVAASNLTSTGGAAPTDDPTATGASLAWTSPDPTLVQARALVADGRFADAASLCQHATGGDAQARQEMIEIIRRARQDYTLDDAQLLAKIRKSIPDATPADIDRWCAAGQL